jgi:glyoxylase-like metal-dependent hydrolase (beta-lactamase superfamily II)
MGSNSAARDDPVDRLLAPGIWQIDTFLGGWAEVNSVFLIEAEQPALIETGPERDLDHVIRGLSRRGLGPEDLAWIVLSHIHLDHAGAVGEIARRFPKAKVVCHPKGLRHLADPARLNAASAQVYGARLDSLYGLMAPVDPGRLVGAEDGARIDLGAGRELTLVYSPGHAKHHIGILESGSGILLVGDAVGVKLPGAGPLRPATPPDDFDLDQAVDSLHRFSALQPKQLILTHFGSAGPPEDVLRDAEDRLRTWAAVASTAYQQEPQLAHVENALREHLGAGFKGDPERQPAADTLTGLASNAAGLYGWLERQAQRQSEVS